MHLISAIYYRGGVIMTQPGVPYFDVDRIKNACKNVGLSNTQTSNVLMELGALLSEAVNNG